VRLWREERTVGDTTPPMIPKTAGFVSICAMEDIGTKDDWAAAQRVFILSRVSKGMGVSTDTASFCPCHLTFSLLSRRLRFGSHDGA